MFFRSVLSFCALVSLSADCFGQMGGLTCRTSAVPPTVRIEGLAEQFGDINLDCSGGAPNGVFSGNLTVFLNTNISNRIVGANNVDVQLLTLSGANYVASPVPAQIVNASAISFTGVTAPLSSTGTLGLRVTNLRGVAGQNGATSPLPIVALLSSNDLLIDNPQVFIASPQPGLAATVVNTVIGCSIGAPIPASPTLTNLYASGAYFSAARVTELFGDAFQKKTATATNGTRILVNFTNLPAGMQLYVPDVIAGSDALLPSVSGVFGGTATGGQYQPTPGGSLLLARVPNADANGAGGSPVYGRGAAGSGVVSFDAVSAVTVVGMNATATYEVVDSNPSIIESAQIPVFVGLAPIPNSPVSSYQVGGSVSFGPLSTVNTYSATEPIPRFSKSTPGSDCGIIGDCGADYYPKLFVDSPGLTYNLVEKAGFDRRYVRVTNQNSGQFYYTATVAYTNGANWIRIFPQAGLSPSTIFIDAVTTSLTPGSYSATVTIDGGLAGKVTLPVNLTVQAAPAQFPGTISSVGNAATFNGPVVSGSLATLMGTKLGGTSVSVTFDGQNAPILFSNDTQINVQVPNLGSKATTQLVVSVGGVQSQPVMVNVAKFSPGIFQNGIANQDNTANGPNTPAKTGTVFQVYLTGLTFPANVVQVKVHDRWLTPLYSGAAPGINGVQQVNVLIPEDLPTVQTELKVCAGDSGSQDQLNCSTPAKIYLVH